MSSASAPCPMCKSPSNFSAKHEKHFCTKCEIGFDAPVTQFPRTIFLSYGHDPACGDLVRDIERDLRARGFKPWVDRNEIRFNDDWRREITEGIRASGHVLAFLSKHSTRTPGVCRQEIAIAFGPGKAHVYTVLVEPENEVTPPVLISQKQWLKMEDWRERKAGDPEAFKVWYQAQFE